MKKAIFTLVLCFSILLSGTVYAQISGEFSQDVEITEAQKQENLVRTNQLISEIKKYLQDNDVLVAFLSRRGAGDPATGVSDTDNLDLTGMAHTGIIVKQGFGKDADYVTYNLVRQRGSKILAGKRVDTSELRVWSLENFFIGSFEKDAIVFVPEKDLQLKLWNILQVNGDIQIEKREEELQDKHGEYLLDENGNHLVKVYNVIKNGFFVDLHNPEYNLLSDFAENSTQNCNEHLIKLYFAVKNYYSDVNKIATVKDGVKKDALLSALNRKLTRFLEKNYVPSHMQLSAFQSTFAFTQNIRFGERYPRVTNLLLGLKWKGEKFDVASVDSFCDSKNRAIFDWKNLKVFREAYDEEDNEWYIQDWGKLYVKVNRFTGKANEVR